MSVLRHLWPGNGGGAAQQDQPRRYFRVTDADIAGQLRGWYQRRRMAEEAVEDYLRRVTHVLGGEVPLYKIDEKGRVESISFRYAIGFTHDGWKGIPNTNWLVPESDAVKKELMALPHMPGHTEINKVIGWPEQEISPDQDIKDRGAARAANRQVHISSYGGAVYVSVPETIPAGASWDVPPFLQEVTIAEGRRAEKFCDFSKSPLGRAIAGALRVVLSHER